MNNILIYLHWKIMFNITILHFFGGWKTSAFPTLYVTKKLFHTVSVLNVQKVLWNNFTDDEQIDMGFTVKF